MRRLGTERPAAHSRGVTASSWKKSMSSSIQTNGLGSRSTDRRTARNFQSRSHSSSSSRGERTGRPDGSPQRGAMAESARCSQVVTQWMSASSWARRAPMAGERRTTEGARASRPRARTPPRGRRSRRTCRRQSPGPNRRRSAPRRRRGRGGGDPGDERAPAGSVSRGRLALVLRVLDARRLTASAAVGTSPTPNSWRRPCPGPTCPRSGRRRRARPGRALPGRRPGRPRGT